MAWLAGGLVLAGWVRPHLAFMVAIALALAVTLGRSSRPTLVTPVVKMGVATCLVVVATVALVQFQELTRQEGSTTEVIDRSLDDLERNSAIGGSQFEAASIRSVADVPNGVFTTLFRPMLHEAPNPLAQLSALESLVILWLFVVRPVLAGRLTLRTFASPFALFGLILVLVFCVGFSNVGNFGWLIRQRAQVLPLLVMFPFVLGDVAVHRSMRTPTADAAGARREA
jgi:hypothetical protein